MGAERVTTAVITAQFTVDAVEELQYDTQEEFLNYLKAQAQAEKERLALAQAKESAATVGKIKRLMFKVKHKFKSFFDKDEESKSVVREETPNSLELSAASNQRKSISSRHLFARQSTQPLTNTPGFLEKLTSAPRRFSHKRSVSSLTLTTVKTAGKNKEKLLGHIVEEDQLAVANSETSDGDDYFLSEEEDKEEAKTPTNAKNKDRTMSSDLVPLVEDHPRYTINFDMKANKHINNMRPKKAIRSCRQSQLDFINKVNISSLSKSKNFQSPDKRKQDNHSMNNYFLNASSTEYQQIKKNKKFSKRSFLLPHEQIED